MSDLEDEDAAAWSAAAVACARSAGTGGGTTTTTTTQQRPIGVSAEGRDRVVAAVAFVEGDGGGDDVRLGSDDESAGAASGDADDDADAWQCATAQAYASRRGRQPALVGSACAVVPRRRATGVGPGRRLMAPAASAHHAAVPRRSADGVAVSVAGALSAPAASAHAAMPHGADAVVSPAAVVLPTLDHASGREAVPRCRRGVAAGSPVAAARGPAVASASESSGDSTSPDGSDASGGGSEEDTSSDSVSSDTESVASGYSTDCVRCDAHVTQSADGTLCESEGCLATLCVVCRPAPKPTDPPWWCPKHAVAAGAGRQHSTRVAETGVPTVAELPEAIATGAAGRSIASAMQEVAAWRDDPDLVDMLDDLADTLEFGPIATATKGKSATRRLAEFVAYLPVRLSRARAVHDVIDIVMATYVNARCGVARASPWQPPRPLPSVVRGEVGAIVGLMRLAALLPPDPRGTIPRTRRALKKCGCCQKYDASPRAYTYAWELEAAWRVSVDHRDPTAVFVWCLCMTAVVFLLRPKYVRMVVPREFAREMGIWRLTWQCDDKGRPAARPAGASALRWVPASGIPARHPRLTAGGGPLVHRAISTAKAARPSEDGPLFCRVERARTDKVPKGAVSRPWKPTGPAAGGPEVPAYWWPQSQLSEVSIKRHMVRFLTPIVGSERARVRVLSGARGGGEMELKEDGAPIHMRATQGWWRARLLAAEGALVTYEGCSIEVMAHWTSRLGRMYIEAKAPGVIQITPPRDVPRGVRSRGKWRRIYQEVIRRWTARKALPRPEAAK